MITRLLLFFVATLAVVLAVQCASKSRNIWIECNDADMCVEDLNRG